MRGSVCGEASIIETPRFDGLKASTLSLHRFPIPPFFCKDGFLSSFTPKSIQPQTPLVSLYPLTKVQTSLLSISFFTLEGSFPNILWSCWNNLLPLRITAHSPQLTQRLRRQLGGHIKVIR
ncbi:hypothetical protein L3X38_018312 [Prunus dulcis]|uniref:Uncharacterized protein n=1 Tax=Prunus dulcis TaxID=3755 RepID=A0AAD4ZAM0_PRUDU|nr:hypothetical protein L3X38_018312 [Prunus dulcis]